METATSRGFPLPADTYKHPLCFFKHTEQTMSPGLKPGTSALLPVGPLSWLLSTGHGDLCVPLGDLEQNW